MDDAAALALEKVKKEQRTAEVLADLQARRHIAVLAVCLTLVGTATIAAAARQVPGEMAAFAAAALGAVAALQLRGLSELAEGLRRTNRQTDEAIDRLMTSGGESNDDAPADKGGTR